MQFAAEHEALAWGLSLKSRARTPRILAPCRRRGKASILNRTREFYFSCVALGALLPTLSCLGRLLVFEVGLPRQLAFAADTVAVACQDGVELPQNPGQGRNAEE